MKNFLFLTFSMLLLFCGCSKDDNGASLDKRLIGTYWQTPDVATSIVYSGQWYHIIHFVSETEYQYYREHNGSMEKFFRQSKYTLDYPDLQIEEMGEYTFINSSTFKYKHGDGYYTTWTKR